METPQLLDTFRIANLITGYLNNTLDDSQRKELFDWIGADGENYHFFCELLDEQQLELDYSHMKAFDAPSALLKVLPKLDRPSKNSFRTVYLRYTAVAAAILVLLGTTFFLFSILNSPHNKLSQVSNHDQQGGIYLTLGDGKKIHLNDTANISLEEKGGVRISKNKDNELVYEVIGTGKAVLNTLSVPKGQQCQVVLPDGTKVWLNAASTLKYASNFDGLAQRTVEMTGEAYFEVKHNEKQPFLVKVAGQTVTDIGTEFNINAYVDETVVKTTLTQGTAKVSDDRNGSAEMLHPGYQTLFSKKTGLLLRAADLAKTNAWKDGQFYFSDDDLPSILRQVSRWYDLEIVYKGKMPTSKFSGQASRKISIQQMLDILKTSGVKADLSGNKLIIQ